MTQKQIVSICKSFQDYLGGSDVRIAVKQDKPGYLTVDDQLRFAHGIALTLAVWCDLYSDTDTRQFTARSLWSWVKEIPSYSVKGVADKLSAMTLAVRELDNIRTPRGFKHLCVESFLVNPEEPFFRLLKPALYRLVEDWSPRRMWEVNTALCFMGRLTLHDIDPSDEMEKWIAVEDHLRTFPFDPVAVKAVKGVLSSIHCAHSTWKPSHSSGAVCGLPRSAPALKFRDSIDNFIDTATEQEIVRQRVEHPLVDQMTPTRNGRLISELRAVPKKMANPRLICLEPAMKQFLQHGIAKQIEAELMNPVWSVTLADQGNNRELCRIASERRTYATIDMSSASDTISTRLCKEILPLSLYGHLLRCSTRYTHVQIPGYRGVYRLEKMASMGNSFCFPLECLIFSACIRAAGGNRRFAVYGDDCVVHQSIYNTVREILFGLGFLVNPEKTYDPYDAFKEACGVEYFNGYDVTPVRIPRQYDPAVSTDRREPVTGELCKSGVRGVRRAKQQECLTDFANRLYSNGLWATRRFLLSVTTEIWKNQVFSLPGSETGIWSDQPTNFHLPHRYNEKLQRHEVRVSQIRSRKVFDEGSAQNSVILHLEALDARDKPCVLPEDLVYNGYDKSRPSEKKVWILDPQGGIM